MIKSLFLIRSAVGSKFKWFVAIFIVLFLVQFAAPLLLFAKTTAPSLRTEIEETFARYAHYMDGQWNGEGWRYSVPSSHYKEIGQNSVQNIRMQATFASMYFFKQSKEADEKIRKSMLDVWYFHPEVRVSSVQRNGEWISTRSFHDAIGIYLSLQILSAHASVFTADEYHTMVTNIHKMYPWVLRAPDTENRALLGAAYGAAILSHPLFTTSQSQRAEYEILIRKKIVVGLQSIDKIFVYHEGKSRQFSLHYHLVCAAMLYVLADQLHDVSLQKIATSMTQYIRKRNPIGLLSWRGSHRPTGIGLQTVLLRTFCEKMAGNPKWMQYWEREKKGRGFIQKENPDRLVWRDEVDKTFNDDYSFANMWILLYRYF